MIASGSSDLGLSDVTIAMSACSAATLPHQRPLPAIAIASRTEDDDDPTVPEPASRFQDGLQRVRRVRVVDDDGERLPGVDRLEAPGNLVNPRDAVRGSPLRRDREAGRLRPRRARSPR